MSGLLGLTDEELARLDQHALLSLRKEHPDLQGKLAPYEHRAFAREQVQRSPVNALGLIGLIPAYQLAKLLGLHGARTGPSLEQMKQGYVGLGEGLLGK